MADVTFEGMNELMAVFSEMEKRAKTARELKVGFFADSKYPDGSFIAQAAFDNEYGRMAEEGKFYKSPRGNVIADQGNPVRPFIRTAMKADKAKFIQILRKELKADKFNSKLALERLGEAMINSIKLSIEKWPLDDPPNSEITIDDKGFNRPLVDTGTMWRSVRKQVK